MSRTPPLVWGMLVAGVLGVSSAGAILSYLDDIPPLMRASWRLQITVIMLLPFATFQYMQMEDGMKEKLVEPRTLWILFGSGVALIRRPHSLEVTGALLGLLGAAITLLDARGGGEVTIWGDFLAFMGAITVVGYIVAGRILREWMPVFVYAVPVTLLGAALLVPASILMGEKTSAIGWVDSELLEWFVLLAFLAGIVGHTGLNACLRWIPPLTISFAVTLEPLIGALIGWLFFNESIPGHWTRLGGLVLIVGIMLVIKGGAEIGVDPTNE